ncbi:MAG: DUF427 domain-containing protein [Nitrospira sp.]|nr:DUF427 domain-containing protein [Nitrospira sp.]MCY4131208.1 DUF427 domain-containing protein [Nitrospira sp.]
MSSPGHPHAITIEQNPNRVKVSFNGTVIADTTRALVLKEGPLPPANYIPRSDVQMSYLQRTDHSTHCPFKGDASYFSVRVGNQIADNAVWAYETPIDAVEQIKDCLSFYKEKLDVSEEIRSE